MTSRIFISYRRDDAAGDAGRLADHVQRRFGSARVFLDIDTIEPGTDFIRVLQASLQETAVMLVVIGPRWTSLRGADGSRRLDDPADFVRMEVEAALGRDIRVVPVLVQGASVPRKEDLPPSLAPLATRQVVSLDHAEFHDDAERLCDRIATVIEGGAVPRPTLMRRWWPALAALAVLALGLAGYFVSAKDRKPPDAASRGTEGPVAATAAVDGLLAQAAGQRRRNQYLEALATLTRARELVPTSPAVREMQEDVAMDWIRNVRVQSDNARFGEAIKPAVAVVDDALRSATGARRADLLSHSGWAAFLMWRDGDRRLDPAEWYREALSLDPVNPYANAMLAHWTLFQDDDLPRAVKLFQTAVRAGRATDAVRVLQWAAYGNERTPEAGAQLVRLADSMRRSGEKLSMSQAQALWAPYYFAVGAARSTDRQQLLEALPPDDHISTLSWALDEYAAKDPSRRLTIRYYVALLHETAGRRDQAVDGLRMLKTELAGQPGSLSDAVQTALTRLQTNRRPGL
jgi:tetratricopeptide (TPR) repeat protein